MPVFVRLLLVFGLSFPSLSWAQNSLEGQQVVVITKEAAIEVSGVKNGTVKEGLILKVDKVANEWLWIASLNGYVNSANVATLPKGLEFFSARIAQSDAPSDYMLRSYVHRAMNELQKALEDNTAALKKDSSKLDWIVTRGRLYQDLGQYDKAIEVCNVALKRIGAGDKNAKLPDLDLSNKSVMIPAATIILNNRGQAYEAKQELDKALSDYNQALQIQANYTRALVNRAKLWMKKGEHGQATADLNEVVKLFPRNAYVLAVRAQGWYYRTDYVKSIADCDAALKIDPANTIAIATRRACLEMRGEWDLLLSELQATQKAKPSAEANNALAWFLATCPSDKHRNGAMAIELASTAVNMTEQKDGTMLDTLAAAYAEAGRWEQAVETEDKAIAIAEESLKEEFLARKKSYAEKQAYHPVRQAPK